MAPPHWSYYDFFAYCWNLHANLPNPALRYLGLVNTQHDMDISIVGRIIQNILSQRTTQTLHSNLSIDGVDDNDCFIPVAEKHFHWSIFMASRRRNFLFYWSTHLCNKKTESVAKRFWISWDISYFHHARNSLPFLDDLQISVNKTINNYIEVFAIFLRLCMTLTLPHQHPQYLRSLTNRERYVIFPLKK